MVRMITLKEILDSSTDKQKEIIEEINKIDEILKITNPTDPAYQAWSDKKADLEAQLSSIKERLGIEGFKIGDLIKVKNPTVLGTPNGGEIIDIKGDILHVSDLGQVFTVPKTQAIKLGKEQINTGTNLPPTSEEVKGGNRDEEFASIVGGSLGSKDKEQRGGNYLGGSKDEVRPGEKPVKPKTLTEQRKLWSKTYKKWFYDHGNYYVDAETGKELDAAQFPTGDLVRNKEKVNVGNFKEQRKFDQKYYDFLDGLRESGVTNMFGAAPYLQREFPELDSRQAREILLDWMENFGKERLTPSGRENPNPPGVPKTDEQRKATHKKKFGTDKLPPRGSGLKEQDKSELLYKGREISIEKDGSQYIAFCNCISKKLY